MQPWTVVDLFSGAGGMSAGFAAHPGFAVIGAVDRQVGKPSAGAGALDCNRTYAANIGVEPWDRDLAALTPDALHALVAERLGDRGLTVLAACPPCTGFSRAVPGNHLADDPRNSLVARMADHVTALQPAVFLLENARELITGNFRHHHAALCAGLRAAGYRVASDTHRLDRFGVPQVRERALVVAVRDDLPLRTLDDLWAGATIDPAATTVRRAIGDLPPVAAGEAHPDDPAHVSPSAGTPLTRRRLAALPRDGGSWADLRDRPDLLTPAMRRWVAAGRYGSYPDIYGRLAWDRPAVTIKRECAHYGNGRYTHPEQDRLCTVRELAILQGFPRSYRFVAGSLANHYRHVGDAVPPIVSHQLAHLVAWIMTGTRPDPRDTLLDGTHLRPGDIRVEAGVSVR